jgi:hypothetical protein
MRIPDALVPTRQADSVVNPEYLSHGTLTCYEFAVSRPFYEKFLGLEVVRHGKRAMALRCGMRFHVVCLEVGDVLQPAHLDNHWGMDVASPEEVDRIYEASLQLKDTYRIRTITDRVHQHGVYSFYIEDVDHNWWEFQYYDGVQHDDFFDFGDRFEGPSRDA